MRNWWTSNEFRSKTLKEIFSLSWSLSNSVSMFHNSRYLWNHDAMLVYLLKYFFAMTWWASDDIRLSSTVPGEQHIYVEDSLTHPQVMIAEVRCQQREIIFDKLHCWPYWDLWLLSTDLSVINSVILFNLKNISNHPSSFRFTQVITNSHFIVILWLLFWWLSSLLRAHWTVVVL